MNLVIKPRNADQRVLEAVQSQQFIDRAPPDFWSRYAVFVMSNTGAVKKAAEATLVALVPREVQSALESAAVLDARVLIMKAARTVVIHHNTNANLPGSKRAVFMLTLGGAQSRGVGVDIDNKEGFVQFLDSFLYQGFAGQ